MAFGQHAHFLFQWDSLWFMEIAQHGYPSVLASTAFFPLLPVIIHSLGPSMALIANQGVCLGILLLLPSSLQRIGMHEAASRRAVWFFALNPALIFYSVLYAEAWTMLGILVTLNLMTRQRIWLAAITALLTTLTQGPALFLGAFPLTLFFSALHRRDFLNAWRSLVVGVACASGFGSYAIYLALTFHRPLLIFQVQHLWGQVMMSPWHQWIQAIGIVVGQHDAGMALLWIAVTLLVLGSLVAILVSVRAGFFGASLYMILGLILSLSFGMTYPFHSTVRFLSDYFPVYGGLAALTSHKWLLGLLLVVSAGIGLLGSVLFAHSWAFQ